MEIRAEATQKTKSNSLPYDTDITLSPCYAMLEHLCFHKKRTNPCYLQKNGCNKIILLTEFKSVSERQIPCFLPFVGPRFSTYDIKTEALKREEVGLAGEYGGVQVEWESMGNLLKTRICRKIALYDQA